jgi:subtilisin family serine protease
MRKLAIAVLGMVAFTGCDRSTAPLQPTTPEDPQFAAAEQAPIYLVTFAEGVRVDATARELARQYGFTIRHLRHHAAPGFSAVIPGGDAEAIAADPRVAIVEKDGPVSLIFPVAAARPGSGGGESTPYGIARVGGPADGTGKTAWVIDTGIDLDHADLNTSKNCHANFVTKGPNSADDGHGHGTHVAGTIGAIDNEIDVVGVAANAYVCAVRVLDNAGFGTWEAVTNGVNYVAANGSSGDAANMSLGGSGSNATLEQAIKDAAAKGIRFAIAAGNDGDFAGNYTPARTEGTNIFTVSAIDSSDCMPSWSNWGNPPVDFAAPGVSVLSTKKGGGTTTMSGTSMAAPHVAGILLLRSSPATDGSAQCDPDGNPDPIAHR